MTQFGMRTVPVNGYLHAFQRGSGELFGTCLSSTSI